MGHLSFLGSSESTVGTLWPLSHQSLRKNTHRHMSISKIQITMKTAPIHYIKPFFFSFLGKRRKKYCPPVCVFFLSLCIFIYTLHCDNWLMYTVSVLWHMCSRSMITFLLASQHCHPQNWVKDKVQTEFCWQKALNMPPDSFSRTENFKLHVNGL